MDGNGEPVGTTIDSVRGALGLSLHPPSHVLKALLVASSGGTGSSVLDFEAFATCITQLVNPGVYIRLTEELQQEHIKLMRHIFDTLCSSSSPELANVRDLGIGLSMFCGGTASERTAVAFWCFDSNNDGYVRRSEMEHYLLVTFTCIFALTGNTTPYVVGDLAKSTTLTCFEEADINHDGMISWSEFVDWYNKSGLI